MTVQTGVLLLAILGVALLVFLRIRELGERPHVQWPFYVAVGLLIGPLMCRVYYLMTVAP